MTERDPRLQQGAYVTDGVDLYEVVRVLRGPGVLGMTTMRILVENCRDLTCLELLPEKIRVTFTLVRSAPEGRCPDLVEEIAWDPEPGVVERRAA